MSQNPQMSCRMHPSTGRLTCTYVTSGRRPSCGTSAPSVEAAERSRREAVRRARRIVDELIHDYDLRWMFTLTYANEPDSHREVFSTLTTFSRRLRSAGVSLPRLTVPEHGPRTRWHLHMLMPTPPDLELMFRLWRRGDIHGPDLEQAASDVALGRLSHYVTKSFHTTPAGARRYVASAGLRPLDQRFIASNAAAALNIATERFGADAVRSDWYAGHFMAFFNPIPTAAAR